VEADNELSPDDAAATPAAGAKLMGFDEDADVG